MKYADLDHRAREKAREKWAEGQTDTSWWDSVYEDAVECGKHLGISIHEKTSRTVRGQSRSDPDIEFAGFWSQGDGCCFSGYLHVHLMADAAVKIKGHAPEDTELHRLGAAAEEIYGLIAAEMMANRLADDNDNRCRYPDCETAMAIGIDGKNHPGFHTRINGDDVPFEVEEACNAFVDAFAAWIYKQLKAEHEYLTSEEAFKEYLADYDPDFDEDGLE